MAKYKMSLTSDFFTLVDDDGVINIRGVISTPIEMEYVLERLKECHSKMLEKPAANDNTKEQANV